MSVTSVDKNLEELSITVIADFEAPIDRVWDLWADPSKLERWWGPPSHPATVVDHDLSEGGMVAYYMTGPEGEKYHGWWKVRAVEPPVSLEFVDGFADDAGNPVEDMPMSTSTMTLTEEGGGTRMVLRSTYETLEQLEEVLEMGALEGVRQSVEQMDAVLAA